MIAAGYRAAKSGNVDAPSQIEVVPLLENAVRAQRRSYLLLFGAVCCVRLIACANIANPLLAFWCVPFLAALAPEGVPRLGAQPSPA